MPIHKDIEAYNAAQSADDQRICAALAKAIDRHLPNAENKIWHRHPVWFLDGNPIVGYCKLKDSVRLLFWSGQPFDEPGLVGNSSVCAEGSSDNSVRLPAAAPPTWKGQHCRPESGGDGRKAPRRGEN